MSKRKFYKTTIQVEVLSEEPYNFENVANLAYDISEGDCSGDVKTVKVEELNGKQAVKELGDQGSDSEFFQLDSDGNDVY